MDSFKASLRCERSFIGFDETTACRKERRHAELLLLKGSRALNLAFSFFKKGDLLLNTLIFSFAK